MTPPRSWRTLIVGGMLGLVVRAAFVPRLGTNDMNAYIAWGRQVYSSGLAASYVGQYYPLQYQLFGFAQFVGESTGLSVVSAYKLLALALDLGAFLLLIDILGQLNLDTRWALVYWLQPYFLAISWLGYVDAEFTFFVLLAVDLMLRSRTIRGFLIAGIPLGAAFLMKPQASLLVGVALALALAALITRKRSERALCLAALLSGPVLWFLAYTAYFEAHGKSLTFLARSYSPKQLALNSPALTANMINIWYPIADRLRHPGQQIYQVVGSGTDHRLGEVVALLLLAAIVASIARRPSQRLGLDVAICFALSAAVLPMVATRAHENHFFAAATLGIIPLAMIASRPAWLAFNALLLAQFLNLLCLYSFGLNDLSKLWPFARIDRFYHQYHAVPVTLSVIAVLSSVVYAVTVSRRWFASAPSRA